MTIPVALLSLAVGILLAEVVMLRREVRRAGATAEFAVRALNVALAAQREDMAQGQMLWRQMLGRTRRPEVATNEPRAPGGMGVLPLKNPGHKPIL